MTSLTPSNIDLLPSYILPNTLPFSTDPETLPRVTYALCCSRIAGVAKKFLDMAEAMKGDGGFEFGTVAGGGAVGDGEFDGNPYAVSHVATESRPFVSATGRLTHFELAGELRHPTFRTSCSNLDASRTSAHRFSSFGPAGSALFDPIAVPLFRPSESERPSPRSPGHVPQHARLDAALQVERSLRRSRSGRRGESPGRIRFAADRAQSCRLVFPPLSFSRTCEWYD